MSEALANQTTFDYSALDDEVRSDVMTERNDIQKRLRRASEDIVEIGKDLIAVKERLLHGQFGEWLAAEFGWTDRTARRFMGVAEAFKSDNLSDLAIAPSALYALAADSTPQEIRDQFLAQAERGEQVTHFQVQEALKGQVETPAETFEALQEVMRRNPDVAQRMENAFVQRAGRDPELHSRIDAAYEEFHPVPIAPPRSVIPGGFGAEVYGAVRKFTPRLQGYLESLKQRQGRPYLDDEIQEEIDVLDRTEALIEEYKSALRGMKSTGYDATFARLNGR